MRIPVARPGSVVSLPAVSRGSAAAVALTVAACGADPGADARPGFTVTDSAGVEVAVTTFAEPVPETGWTIDPASEIEFGGAGDEIHFTWIRATELPDGRVVALDPRAQELFVFAQVRVHDPARGLVRIDRLERPRRPVTDETLDDYRTFVIENAPDANARERTLERRGTMPVADSLPWIQGLMPDASGNVWVMEYRVPGADSAAVGVFSAGGEWLGSVRLPPRFRPLEIGEDYLLGVRTDELDVPHLVRYGLTRPTPPGRGPTG